MTDLKPCPFCGGTNIESWHRDGFVTCEDCFADGPFTVDGDGETAIEAWNRRANETDT